MKKTRLLFENQNPTVQMEDSSLLIAKFVRETLVKWFHNIKAFNDFWNSVTVSSMKDAIYCMIML